MDEPDRETVAYRRLAFFGTVTGLAAIGALAWLVTHHPPLGMPLVAFFLLSFLATWGLSCPITAFLNHRFPRIGGLQDAMRQSLWLGLLVTLSLWLRVEGVFSWSLTIMLAAVFLLVELFVRRTREDG